MNDFIERRNLALRSRRDAVAAYFELHPAALAAVPADAVQAMASRIDQDRGREHEFLDLQVTVQQWQELARTDALTGLANRRALEERLTEEIDRTNRYGRPLAVLLADLDNLKLLNDRHGHQVGDAVLVEVASRLRRAVRRADLVGRWAGDEFMIICPEADSSAARLIAAKLVHVVRATPTEFAEWAAHTTISVGYAVAVEDADRGVLVRAADSALYRAKASGRNRSSA